MATSQSFRLNDFHPGFKFLQNELLEQIGYGGQGFVWSALDQSHNRIVAIKFSEVSDPELKQESESRFKHQAGQLAQLVHPNILPLYDFGSILPIRYLVSPYIAGGSLQDRLQAGPLPIEEGLQYCLKIASALDYLHSQGIIHRDLKPSNILMDYGNRLYVADFGLARMIADTTLALHTGHGTPPYAPPEQHTMGELTYRSDIFGFGIMLYQILTRQLPWNGEKSLGLQQLYSKEEIPDPREINPELPREILNILRIMTSANPATRPNLVTDAVKMVYSAFGIPLPVTQTATSQSVDSNLDAETLLKQSLSGWDPEEGTIRLSLTKFALIDLEQKRTAEETPAGTDLSGFMLQNALTYGYDDHFWWAKVADPKERLFIASRMLSKDNRVINERAVRHLVRDKQIRSLRVNLPVTMTLSLLYVARRTDDPSFQKQVFDTIHALTPQAKQWRATALGATPDTQLASLALEQNPMGNEAAKLIGHLRSQLAVDTLIKGPKGERRSTALLAIQQSAGSLPDSLPRRVRLEITGEWMTRRLIDQPMVLLMVYVWIALGAALSVGLQVYLTIRLLRIMDFDRILISLERGILLGVLFGLGILMVRIIVERFPEPNAIIRVGLAILLGGLLLNIAKFIFDVLILKTVPQGILLISASSLLIALGFALSGLVRLLPVKVLITLAAVLMALAGSWWGHLLLSRTGVTMTPFFYYDYLWTPAQVLVTMLIVALPMTVLGNLGNISPKHE